MSNFKNLNLTGAIISLKSRFKAGLFNTNLIPLPQIFNNYRNNLPIHIKLLLSIYYTKHPHFQMSTSLLEIAPCESLVSLRRRNALENVQEVITQRASGIILSELSTTDYQWYQKMESERMQELSDKVSDLVTSEVAPAILAYLSKRFPERMNHPDTE